MKLSAYLQDLGSLLVDQNFVWNTQAQMVRWINQARQEVAELTGCVERHLTGQSAFGASAQPGSLIPGGGQPGAVPAALPNALNSASVSNSFSTLPGIERYPFQGFANEYLRAQHQGCDQIVDVSLVSPNWGGSIRPALDWLPWDVLQARARAYANLVSTYPFWWSVMNDGPFGEVFMFPTPSAFGEMEWDVFCLPTDLESDDDFDAIPDGMARSVKFKAAALAFLGSYRYAQAEALEGQFLRSAGVSSVARNRGKVPSYYDDGI